jgi:hypothetical protein
VNSSLFAQLTRLAVSYSTEYKQGDQDVLHLLSLVEGTPSLTDLAVRNHMTSSGTRSLVYSVTCYLCG